MNANPIEAQKHSELKRKLVAKHPDNMDSYIAGKNDFIKEIDRQTEKWFEES